jgi:hypothetical protein
MASSAGSAPGSKRAGVISVARDTDEGLDFFRTRLALYNAATGMLSFVFLVVANIAGARALHRSWSDLLANRGNQFHVLELLFFLIGWAVCRFARPSRRALEILDAVLILGVGVCHALIGYVAPRGAHPALDFGGPPSPTPPTVTNANIIVLTFRSILVPSTPRRTLGLGVGTVLPMISVAHVFHAQQPGPGAVGVVVGVYLWSFIAVAIGTIISAVTYSLQEQVREARQLGQYILEAKIGEGGMGVVYRARHAMLRRPTAIKLLPPGKSRERDVLRFEREVQMTSRLTHPNTISVYDFGRTPDGIFYYAMELLDGVDLERLVRAKGPLAPPRAMHVLGQICGALSEAHEAGMIHRDIKPGNVFLCRQGGAHDVAKVLDFGLVRDVGREASNPALSLTGTAAGIVVGTPHYLAPEAILRPESVDARSDLYAVGCVAYFLLTGRPPFDGRSFVELCGHHLHTVAPPISSLVAGVPAVLEALVADCLAKDPAQRPGDARTLRQRILACAEASWTDEDARLWWTANADWLDEAARGRAMPPSELGATIAVDLRARVAGPPPRPQ